MMPQSYHIHSSLYWQYVFPDAWGSCVMLNIYNLIFPFLKCHMSFHTFPAIYKNVSHISTCIILMIFGKLQIQPLIKFVMDLWLTWIPKHFKTKDLYSVYNQSHGTFLIIFIVEAINHHIMWINFKSSYSIKMYQCYPNIEYSSRECSYLRKC